MLCGPQGTGKTVVGDVMRLLFPQHYLLVDSEHLITGRFSAHLKGCLLLHADEAVFAGKPQVIARLKSMITSRVTMREGKYANAGSFDNDLRLLITSNEHRVVPAAFEERRFAVLEVGTGRQNDHGFFGAVYRELEEGGLGRLLHLLQTFPLSTVNLRQIPKTAALRDQKLASLSAIDAWWFERLRAGVNRRGRGSWQDVVTYDDQYETYLDPVGGVRARPTASRT